MYQQRCWVAAWSRTRLWRKNEVLYFLAFLAAVFFLGDFFLGAAFLAGDLVTGATSAAGASTFLAGAVFFTAVAFLAGDFLADFLGGMPPKPMSGCLQIRGLASLYI